MTAFPLGSQKDSQSYWPSIAGVHRTDTLAGVHFLVDFGYTTGAGWEMGARVLLDRAQLDRLIDRLIEVRGA